MEENMVLRLMRVRENSVIPKQATEGSAGYDLCACIDAPVTIESGARYVFPSGLAAEIPKGTAGFIRNKVDQRLSDGKKHIIFHDITDSP